MAVVVACAVLHNVAVNAKEDEPAKDPMVAEIGCYGNDIETDEFEDGEQLGREPFLAYFYKLLCNKAKK
ncbi:hypothetical protein J437_LFUL015113 [Ladona fulva]|uniref:Uncharacterized protein n=1 Tax=Ladona fulva TaxID=123851 RepID=A0A8K0P5F9_LADFU|nr:hypothetical protein J437_LFUL015113 [Ladona fulva]